MPNAVGAYSPHTEKQNSEKEGLPYNGKQHLSNL